MSRSVNSSSACWRILRVRSSSVSRAGLMAQTMSLIELTDSRAIRAIDTSGPPSAAMSSTAGDGPEVERTAIVVCVATWLSSAMRVRLAPMSSCRSVAIRVRMLTMSSNRAIR